MLRTGCDTTNLFLCLISTDSLDGNKALDDDDKIHVSDMMSSSC